MKRLLRPWIPRVVATELIDRCRKALRDVAVTQMLAHDGAVLGLGLGVVVAVPGATIAFDQHSSLAAPV